MNSRTTTEEISTPITTSVRSDVGVLAGRRSWTHWLGSPALIVAVALAWRVSNIFMHRLWIMPDSYDHLWFGYEMGRIARSVVAGHGFSSPFPEWSGPTAWLGPVYPLLLAAMFKIFGVYSNASAAGILILNSVFSALTCLTIYLIGKELFGTRVGVISAWIWAIAPYAVYWSAWIWETSLSALLLSVIFLLTLRLDRDPRLRNWLLFGLVWGVIALTSASALAFLPVAVVWLWYRARKQGTWSYVPVAAGCLVFLLTIAPWAGRNYRVFGKLVFPRSDFGEELYMGNHEGSQGLCMFWDHPVWNKYEMAQFSQQGELAYVAEKQKLAVEWIRQNPGRFATLTLKRIGFFWFNIPEQGRMANHFGMGSRHALYFGFALLAFWGLGLALRRGEKGAFLFAGLFLLFPLVYYITHSHPRYQHPITPEMLLLSVYLLYGSYHSKASVLRRRG
jgi:hypothetical protein